MKDYYSILGVSRSASEAEIKRAYRKLAVLYHPDKNKDPRAQEIFVEVTEAYDIIADPIRRRGYDALLSGTYSTATVTEQPKPRHRDPAYRRRQPHARPSQKFSDTYYLMKDYLKYFKWAGRVGLAVSVLFFIDYILPYKKIVEKIIDVYHVRGVKGSGGHSVMVTSSGREIKLYGEAGTMFQNESTIVAEYTWIYATPMQVSSLLGTEVARLAYMYGGLILIPLALLFSSSLSLFYKNRIELCFNSNLVSGLLLILFLILI